ncbi:hypothetical protein MHL31_02960 [Lutibacter sp. A80]|uniref:hypothetical protein n=1 Tax=Lutibacter sp. A80 TaxID=2918453 RepID=UPI001F054056|nr:hypothetical protein [Lutibacter sp. A80]UMB61173.1 hypothetical protein MHL31_02960 [Lutibacter sp. A80]
MLFLAPTLLLGQVKKTEVLVFGTAHLSQMQNFEIKMLDKAIDKLDNFEFDVVCIEKMQGQLLYDIKCRNNPVFNGVVNGRWGKPYLTIADTI